MQPLRVNGILTSVAVAGDPDGLPLVFAHALGTDLRVWDALLPHLPPGLRLVRYDLRGHGLATAPAGDYWMGDLVADAAGVIEALGLRGAVLVGVSLGGVVAQGLAAERRDLVRAVVLANTAAKIGTEESWRARIAAVRAGGLEAIADSVLAAWFTRRFHAGHPDALALWRTLLLRTPRDGYTGACAALADTDLRDSTAGLRLPALVLASSDDGATPPDLVREMAGTIDGADFVLIRGAGHLPPVERPEATAAAIVGFLARHRLL